MKLTLFFTFEMSLAKWDQAGILDRELALYRRLSGYAVKTCLLTYGGAEESKYSDSLGLGLEILPLFSGGPDSKWRRFFFSWLKPLLFGKIIRSADIVKTNQMWGAWSGLISKLFLKKKWILRCGFEHHRFLILQDACLRDRWFSFILSWIAYRLADAVVWSNESDRDWAVKIFRLKTDDPRFHFIPNYVDTGLFKKPAMKPEGFRIITVARLDKQKNLDILIRALEGSNYQLEIVGEGPQRRQLEELAGELGVKVVFAGRLPQKQIPEHLDQARVFVLCSQYEGMPKSLLEAMSCGMPVMGTDVPGIRDVIDHENTGLLCRAEPESIRGTLDRLFADENLRNRIGAAAREYIEQYYSLDKITQMELDLYQKLVDER